MMVQYKPNAPDQTILGEITNKIRASLYDWYGHGARLSSAAAEILSYPNCFMLRYPLSISSHEQKAILVKIRRNPKMSSLHQAIQSDLHQNMITEYQTLELVYNRIANTDEDLRAIRPLAFLKKFFAIVMEEYTSQTMHQLMDAQRSAGMDWEASALKDAARKTGRWLYTFHQQINTAYEKEYTARDLVEELRPFAEKIETSSRGRISAHQILDSFSAKIQTLPIDKVLFSQCHQDMTTNNVLYSEQGGLCLIDVKNRPAPVYTDLGLILTYPETSKPQIFSRGTYYPESLLRKYRSEIIAGYFDHEAGDEVLVKVYSALKVVDKWAMYEELMSRYKGLKRAISIPAAPLVSLYFQNLLKKHLALIGTDHPEQTITLDKKTANNSL